MEMLCIEENGGVAEGRRTGAHADRREASYSDILTSIQYFHRKSSFSMSIVGVLFRFEAMKAVGVLDEGTRPKHWQGRESPTSVECYFSSTSIFFLGKQWQTFHLIISMNSRVVSTLEFRIL